MAGRDLTGAAAMLRRYKWEDLTDPEKEAVSDAVKIGATRAGVGLGFVLTAAAIFSNARRGKPPLPPLIRYTSLASFSFAGAYAGFLSAGPLCAQRILAVPNSKLAEDLRIVAGDWQARVPSISQIQEPDSSTFTGYSPSLSNVTQSRKLPQKEEHNT